MAEKITPSCGTQLDEDSQPLKCESKAEHILDHPQMPQGHVHTQTTTLKPKGKFKHPTDL